MAHAMTPNLSSRPGRASPDRLKFGRPGWLIDPAHAVVYCPIPKCASTTVKHWLIEAIEGRPYAAPPGSIHAHARSRHALSQLDPAEASRFVTTATSFTLIRDPAWRLLSTYTSKLVSPSADLPLLSGIRIIEQAHQLTHGPIRHDRTMPVFKASQAVARPASSRIDYARGLSLRELVDLIEHTPDAQLDRHLRPQHWFTRGYEFDILGTPESIHETLTQVGIRSGIKTPPPPQARTRTGGPADSIHNDMCLADTPSGELRDRGIIPSIANMLDDDLCRRIRTRFARDCVLYAKAQRASASPAAHAATVQ